MDNCNKDCCNMRTEETYSAMARNNCEEKEWTINCHQRMAYAYVPVQNSVMTNIYGPEMGLERGTIFPYLDIPLGVYGFQFPKKENMK